MVRIPCFDSVNYAPQCSATAKVATGTRGTQGPDSMARQPGNHIAAFELVVASRQFALAQGDYNRDSECDRAQV